MIRSIKSAENTVYVLHALIFKLKISISSFTIEKELDDHPHYPSMRALSDCLTSWTVPNEAFRSFSKWLQTAETLQIGGHTIFDKLTNVPELVEGWKELLCKLPLRDRAT